MEGHITHSQISEMFTLAILSVEENKAQILWSCIASTLVFLFHSRLSSQHRVTAAWVTFPCLSAARWAWHPARPDPSFLPKSCSSFQKWLKCHFTHNTVLDLFPLYFHSMLQVLLFTIYLNLLGMSFGFVLKCQSPIGLKSLLEFFKKSFK